MQNQPLVTVWYLVGPKAGTREQMTKDQAAELLADDTAELVGTEPLRYAENHPYVREGKVPHPHANKREDSKPKQRKRKRSAE